MYYIIFHSCHISLDSCEIRIATGIEGITITVTIKGDFPVVHYRIQLLMIIKHINNVLEN